MEQREEKLGSVSGPGEKKREADRRGWRKRGKEKFSQHFILFISPKSQDGTNFSTNGTIFGSALQSAVFLKHLNLGICPPQQPETLWKEILVKKGFKLLTFY